MIYAYIRVSTEMQNYASQEYEIRNYCLEKGIKVDKWVSESISGTVKVEKRTLGKVIRKMDRGDMLICTEISRLGRNMLMIMSILNTCSAKGIYIHSIKDNFDLSDNINSKIIAFAFALAAEIERNLISQRTREALASRKKEKICKYYEIIMEKHNEGVSFVKLAKQYKIHRNTLRKYLDSCRLENDKLAITDKPGTNLTGWSQKCL